MSSKAAAKTINASNGTVVVVVVINDALPHGANP